MKVITRSRRAGKTKELVKAFLEHYKAEDRESLRAAIFICATQDKRRILLEKYQEVPEKRVVTLDDLKQKRLKGSFPYGVFGAFFWDDAEIALYSLIGGPNTRITTLTIAGDLEEDPF